MNEYEKSPLPVSPFISFKDHILLSHVQITCESIHFRHLHAC